MDENTKKLHRDVPLVLTPGESLVLIGFSRDVPAGERTARNMLCRGAKKPFPLPIIEILGRKRVLRSEVYRFLGLVDGAVHEELVGMATDSDISRGPLTVDAEPKARKGPGRPRKSDAPGKSCRSENSNSNSDE